VELFFTQDYALILKPKFPIVPIEIGNRCKTQNHEQDGKEVINREVGKDAQLSEDR